MSDYMQKLQELGNKLHAVLGADFHIVSYSGGVPGGTTKEKIPFYKYNYLLFELTKLFGEPTQREPWHPNHTKLVPPVEWKLAKEMKTNELYHVQLISMMQRKSKRYLIISYM